MLLSQQEERHLLERNVNAALQKKMEELQRNFLQVIPVDSFLLARLECLPLVYLDIIHNSAKVLQIYIWTLRIMLYYSNYLIIYGGDIIKMLVGRMKDLSPWYVSHGALSSLGLDIF